MIKLIKATFYKEALTKKKLIKFINSAKQLSFGLECQKFEKNFARYQGRRHCVLVNSGSSANLALIQSLLNLGKIKKGDQVAFSVVTWPTGVFPLIQLGLNPIPVDIELSTLNISSQKFKKIIKKHKIKMLFMTNLLGFCHDPDKIKKICDENSIILTEDNCESLGSIYKGKKLGNFGLASTFSFYVGHHLSTIEGGAICTDDEELSIMLRIVRAHGWDRNLDFIQQKEIRKKFKVDSTFYSRYAFYDLGFNLRPTEIVGLIGNFQLRYINEIIHKRQDNFMKMAPLIYTQVEKFYPIKYDHLDFFSNFAVPVICRSQKIRDQLVNKCEGKVEIRPIVGGNMVEQPFFQKYVKKSFSEFPAANIIHNQGLYFGNNPDLNRKEIKTIIDIFTS